MKIKILRGFAMFLSIFSYNSTVNCNLYDYRSVVNILIMQACA